MSEPMKDSEYRWKSKDQLLLEQSEKEEEQRRKEQERQKRLFLPIEEPLAPEFKHVPLSRLWLPEEEQLPREGEEERKWHALSIFELLQLGQEFDKQKEEVTRHYIEAVKNEVRNYINNHLPIYLLDLRRMRLIYRTKFVEHFESDVHNYCLGDKISKSGHFHSDLAYVETLRSDAKTWIKDTAGYAILSHHWGSNELTFSDISQFENIGHGSDQSIAAIQSTLIPKMVTDLAKGPTQTPYAEFGLLEAMKALCDSKALIDHQGFVKIIQFFTMSRKYNCNLVWFDSGCIDKDRSAELEESIRSMFNWYRDSKICIVHLSGTSNTSNIRSDPWFTRGWTLQELLAPQRVKFVDRSWKPLTYRISFDDDDKLVCNSEQKKIFWEHVLDITQISDEHIANFKPSVHHASDALRWMAPRETTRDEDIAYCLVGLLGIPLTIAYGEGTEAFYRLQVEILQHTSDMGLFAWLGRPAIKNSMLASEPKCFLKSVSIKSLFDNEIAVPIAITGYGLHITLLTYEVTNPKDCRPSGRSTVKLKIKGLHSIDVVLETIDEVGSGTWDNDEADRQTSENIEVGLKTSGNNDVQVQNLGGNDMELQTSNNDQEVETQSSDDNQEAEAQILEDDTVGSQTSGNGDAEVQNPGNDDAEKQGLDDNSDDETDQQSMDDDNSSIEFQRKDGDGDFVQLQTTYTKVELAVLGKIRGSQPKKYLAILLGFNNGQCKRIPTQSFVKVSLPKRENWPKPKDFYIQ